MTNTVTMIMENYLNMKRKYLVPFIIEHPTIAMRYTKTFCDLI